MISTKLLKVGCDKISINSHAIKNPDFINEASKRFGSQCIVIAIDAKKTGEKLECLCKWRKN